MKDQRQRNVRLGNSSEQIAIQIGERVNLSELEFINIVHHEHVTSVKLQIFGDELDVFKH